MLNRGWKPPQAYINGLTQQLRSRWGLKTLTHFKLDKWPKGSQLRASLTWKHVDNTLATREKLTCCLRVIYVLEFTC